MTTVLICAGAIVFLIIFIRIFASPLKLLLKLIFNTLLGFLALFLFNLLSPITGFTLGINPFNAIVTAILGLPGFGLLLLLRWLCLT